MNWTDAKDTIKARVPCKDFLERDRHGNGYICPICGSGSGPNGSGAVKLYPDNSFYCHACKKRGDVFTAYRKRTGADFSEAVKDLARQAGITLDEKQDRERDYSGQRPPEKRQERPESSSGKAPEKQEKAPAAAAPAEKAPPRDYREYCNRCAAILQGEGGGPGREYLERRGISMEAARICGIGYDPIADPAGKGHPRPRVILPLHGKEATGYQARAISDEGLPAQYRKMNPAGTPVYPFNEAILWADFVDRETPVFICEGPFDALSFLEIGFCALSLNGAGNVGKLLERLEKRPTLATIVVCMDTDGPGQKAAQELRQGLDRLNISHTVCDLKKYAEGIKDANEFLVKDREAFTAAAEMETLKAKTRPDSVALYANTLMAGDMERFQEAIPTGYSNLDKLTGGLYQGLYCLAAISSLGKTTFAAQMADQIAQSGRDVLFFSLEQSRLELISKSFARELARNGADRLTSLQIMRGTTCNSLPSTVTRYLESIGDRLSVIEGNFSMDCDRIAEYIRQYIRRTDCRPVVFIDYLQIIDPGADGKGHPLQPREAVDETVKKLKRLSRELGLTVIVISSVNRANYTTPISFESLKESGGIEYSCDVVYGLQLEALSREDSWKTFAKDGGVTEKRKIIDEAKEKIPRELELVILKNRYGQTNKRAYFKYRPDVDLFTPWTDRGGKLA